MRTGMLALYHRIPRRARSAAATLRGYYLRYWRKSKESALLIEAALERDSWSAAQWRTWREERLAYTLHRAATRVPYYRAQWAARRRRGDRASWEVLEHWPILEKDDVRAEPGAFVADDCDRGRMFHEQTSGTTGKPLDIWRTRRTVVSLYALATARTRRWRGVPEDARFARLGGQLVVPIEQRQPPFWVWNGAMNQLYMSTYHLAPDLLPYYLDALERYRITYLAGYTSSLVDLAQAALREGRRLHLPWAAFTNAEPVRPDQRMTITAAFGCPVAESYGMAETVAAASECPAGRLHQWPEVGHIEVLTEGPGSPMGEGGEYVCTGLLNLDMPLIRYRVGDSGRALADHGRCACGRSLPTIPAIEGRTTDLLITPDGRRIFWLNPVFYGLPVRQSQIVQDALDHVTVRVAPAPEFSSQTGKRITERLRQRMGEVRVDLEMLDEVPRTENGKLRAVVCALDPAEKAAALGGAQRVAASGAGR